ncbi:MAG: iron-sulfur cluster assembly protein [Ulvibacter sp.]|jgi:iron-sulfur cluster assembly protein
MQFMKLIRFKKNHIDIFYFIICYKNVISNGKRFIYSIFVVNLDKIYITMIQVSETAKKKIIDLMKEDGFDAAVDYVRVGVKSGGCSGLSYDLKFDKTKGEDDKIFVDNDITIAVEKKSFLYLAGTILEFSGGINGKGFVFNNPNASRTCGCGESFSL